jgi:hypothetical protein
VLLHKDAEKGEISCLSMTGIGIEANKNLLIKLSPPTVAAMNLPP